MPTEYTVNRIFFMMGTQVRPYPVGTVREKGHFFGVSKSDLAGDKLVFRHLSVRPGCSEQSLGTTSSYSRGTNG